MDNSNTPAFSEYTLRSRISESTEVASAPPLPDNTRRGHIEVSELMWAAIGFIIMPPVS